MPTITAIVKIHPMMQSAAMLEFAETSEVVDVPLMKFAFLLLARPSVHLCNK